MDSTLIACRMVHFIATVQVAGLVIFRYVVSGQRQSPGIIVWRLGLMFWLSFGAMLISGAGWALSVARAIDDTSTLTALQDGTALSVLTDTQFGNAWMLRFATAVALPIVAAFTPSHLQRIVQLILAAVLVGGLAFAGHGASSPGMGGSVHLAADIFHLVAVASWVGGLLPYAITVHALVREDTPNGIEAARVITQRYSNMAIIAVLTILATGIVNAFYLVGKTQALVATEYGRLLSLKVVVFVIMLVLASINRFVLMARFSAADVSALNRNALIELVLAAAALLLVAVFGTMAPPTF